MGWSSLGRAANSASNGGRYLKLTDGSRYELLMLGPPHQKEVTWQDGRTSIRFAAVVYCTDSPSGAQQFEFGPGVARDLAAELTGHDETATKVMVSRKGSGKTDTRYTVARIGKATKEEVRAASVADADRTWELAEEGWWPLEDAAPAPAPAAKPAKARPSTFEAPDDDVPF